MKYFSSFSGVGGFEIGIGEKMECVGLSETDKYASMVLKYRFPKIKNYDDIKKIDWSEVPDFDLLVGGSPCQDLSIAGKRKGITGERSGLFAEFVRTLQEKKPKYFIWENVKGALSSNQGWDFTEVQNQMAEQGYQLWWQILNAKYFGVPQNRERIFIIGFREESSKKVFFEKGIGNQNSVIPTLTTRYKEAQANGAYLRQISPKGGSQGERVYDTKGIATTIASNAGGLGAKTGLYAIPVLTPDREKKRQNGRRFKENGDPMFTLTGQDKHGIYNGERIRRLTPKECERLMSWPDDWTRWGINEKGEKIEISDSQRYKMCGNGVVSNIIKELINLFL